MTTGKVDPGDEPGILCAWGPAFARLLQASARPAYSSASSAAAPSGAEVGRPRQFQKEHASREAHN